MNEIETMERAILPMIRDLQANETRIQLSDRLITSKFELIETLKESLENLENQIIIKRKFIEARNDTNHERDRLIEALTAMDTNNKRIAELGKMITDMRAQNANAERLSGKESAADDQISETTPMEQ